MRNSIPDPELLKQMRHISNVNLTIDSKFTSQGQLLLIDLQEDMASSWRNTVTALILLCLVVERNCEVDHFSFQVVEKGTLVNEKIEVDVENQEEIIRVPKHNDLDEVQILNDFNKGLSVHRVPSTKDCFVYELDPSFPSPAKMILDMEEVSNQPIPNKVTTKTVRTRVLGLANRLALPRRVVDFCGTFPIYNAVKVPLDSMNTTLYKIQDGGRQRRDFEVRTLKYCSTQDGQALEDCINKVGGYNFKIQCRYRHASCYYVAQCRHVSAITLTGRYRCTSIHHEVNVKTLCCKPAGPC